MICSSCGEPTEDRQSNGRPQLCPDCSLLRRRERNQKWKEEHPSEVNAKWRENYHKRKYSQEPRHPCKPQHGVDILYHGCASMDHISKAAFMQYRDAFEVGDKYKLDGVWYEVTI
jgi:hypothetical protein